MCAGSLVWHSFSRGKSTLLRRVCEGACRCRRWRLPRQRAQQRCTVPRPSPREPVGLSPVACAQKRVCLFRGGLRRRRRTVDATGIRVEADARSAGGHAMRATSALGVHYPLIHPLAFRAQRGGERAGGAVRGRRERRDRRRHNWAPLRRWRCLCLELETNAQIKMCSTFWATAASLSIELHACASRVQECACYFAAFAERAESFSR
jgi:hypothetical protein